MWNSANTSTISNTIVSSKVFIACLVHYRECLSRNLSAKVPELATSWYWMSRTVRTNTLVDHGSFLLTAGFQLSCSCLRSQPVPYSVSWSQCTLKSIDSHAIACSVIFVLHQIVVPILACEHLVTFVLAVLVVWWWTNWCLRCCCVSPHGGLDQSPVIWHYSDPPTTVKVFVEPWLAVVEKVRKTIMKRCGKS